MLTPVKWVGWIATFFWSLGVIDAVGLLISTNHATSYWGNSDAAHLFVLGWGPFFFWYLLPACRWVAEAEVTYRLGLPEPKFRPKRTGSFVNRIYESLNRGIAAYGDTGTLVVPSDDGINDLGQTGGLPKSVANSVGYRQIHVQPVVNHPHCERCGSELIGGPRRCRSCGVYVKSDGRTDYDAHTYEPLPYVRERRPTDA